MQRVSVARMHTLSCTRMGIFCPSPRSEPVGPRHPEPSFEEKHPPFFFFFLFFYFLFFFIFFTERHCRQTPAPRAGSSRAAGRPRAAARPELGGLVACTGARRRTERTYNPPTRKGPGRVRDPRARQPATRTSPSERAAAARPGSAPPHSAGRKPAYGWREGRLVADVDWWAPRRRCHPARRRRRRTPWRPTCSGPPRKEEPTTATHK